MVPKHFLVFSHFCETVSPSPSPSNVVSSADTAFAERNDREPHRALIKLRSAVTPGPAPVPQWYVCRPFRGTDRTSSAGDAPAELGNPDRDGSLYSSVLFDNSAVPKRKLSSSSMLENSDALCSLFFGRSCGVRFSSALPPVKRDPCTRDLSCGMTAPADGPHRRPGGTPPLSSSLCPFAFASSCSPHC